MPEAPGVASEAAGHDVNVIVGALADSDRRRLLAAIELGAATLQDAAKVSGLPDHRAAKALARLVAGGLVVSDADGGLRVDGAMFAGAARARPGPAAQRRARWRDAGTAQGARGVRP